MCCACVWRRSADDGKVLTVGARRARPEEVYGLVECLEDGWVLMGKCPRSRLEPRCNGH
jgi:hypothetical protein